MLSMIVATDLKNGIGIHNQLPWHLPNDLKHFKALTLGKPILMGRKTFESIGKPLPLRRSLVVSRHGFTAPGAEVFPSIDAALTACHNEPEIMVIGGGLLYQALFEKTSKIYRTLVHTVVTADTFFPTIDEAVWQKKSADSHTQDSKHMFDYTFEVWERKSSIVMPESRVKIA